MLSQYAHSPKFVKLVEGLKAQFDNSKTIEDWFRLVFNLKTAVGYGLDIWGLILNQGRLLYYVEDGVQKSIFLKGSQTVGTESYSASQIEEYYRLVLFLRLFSYITNSTIYNYNNLLKFYFGNRKVYVQELNTMVIEYVFEFFPTKLEKIIFSTELCPKPTGVGVHFRFFPAGSWFGFFDDSEPEEQPFAPFNHKPFYSYDNEGI